MAPPGFERAVAHGEHTGNLRALLALLKYDGLEPIAGPLGALLAARIAPIENLPATMLVVPVPLYKGKQRHRGFNQSELLARVVCHDLRRLRPEWRGELASNTLLRERETRAQVELTPLQRRRNLRGVFSVLHPERLRGRHVLLIDDIYTTGATARACSLALKKTGAATVWVATVARAQLRQPEIRFAAARVPDETPLREDVALWDGGKTAP